jgi:hypothetical protein
VRQFSYVVQILGWSLRGPADAGWQSVTKGGRERKRNKKNEVGKEGCGGERTDKRRTKTEKRKGKRDRG